MNMMYSSIYLVLNFLSIEFVCTEIFCTEILYIGLAKKFARLMNTLFNKVLGENEKCVLFLLKTK